MTDEEVRRIAHGYRQFAEVEAAEASPRYAELARAVADHPGILGFLAGLPRGNRQPNLFLSSLQFLHGRPPQPDELADWVLGDADRLSAVIRKGKPQTNEPARCGALLPVLASMPGPLALIEVGASAGLCLYPDRYSYEYDGRRVGPPSPVHLQVRTTGAGPVPDRLPEVVARIGIDLHPLDATDPDDRAWLRAFVWPGPAAADRLARLDAAADVARRDPPQMLTGDLLDRLPDALDRVPEGSTAVVFHTAVLPFVPAAERDRFVALVRELPVRWIAQEGPFSFPKLGGRLRDEARGRFLLALDGRPLAWTAPHGGRIDWLPDAREIMAG